MPDEPYERFSKMRPDELMREFGMSWTIRWISPWAWFVLALAVGRVLTEKSAIHIDELVFGLPLSWLAAWIGARDAKVASVAAGGIVVASVGLAIGLLAY